LLLNPHPRAGKKAKMEAAAATASQNIVEAAALKLQQAATADAFRGVHLDPKAHHWDDVSGKTVSIRCSSSRE
jgi:hypothetical protein